MATSVQKGELLRTGIFLLVARDQLLEPSPFRGKEPGGPSKVVPNRGQFFGRTFRVQASLQIAVLRAALTREFLNESVGTAMGGAEAMAPNCLLVLRSRIALVG